MVRGARSSRTAPYRRGKRRPLRTHTAPPLHVPKSTLLTRSPQVFTDAADFARWAAETSFLHLHGTLSRAHKEWHADPRERAVASREAAVAATAAGPSSASPPVAAATAVAPSAETKEDGGGGGGVAIVEVELTSAREEAVVHKGWACLDHSEKKSLLRVGVELGSRGAVHKDWVSRPLRNERKLRHAQVELDALSPPPGDAGAEEPARGAAPLPPPRAAPAKGPPGGWDLFCASTPSTPRANGVGDAPCYDVFGPTTAGPPPPLQLISTGEIVVDRLERLECAPHRRHASASRGRWLRNASLVVKTSDPEV